MFGTALLLASVAVGAWAACPYELKNLKISTCDGKPVDGWTLKGVGVELTNECYIRFKGCFIINEKLSDVKIHYKAIKGISVLAMGTEEVCGVTLFNTTFTCPMPKGLEICSTDDWVKKISTAMLEMGKGNLKGEAKVKTTIGEKCYKLSVDIIRK